uniref:SCP domain-containing protein n=1 Tax=Meloidogyne incognita TaxID=6306 RepID=A0A914LYJ2_MELIC
MFFLLTIILVLITIFEYNLIKTLTPEGRNYVVSLHNDYRSQLTQGKSANLSGENMPTGKNIKQMSYSVDIENIAQQWANNCTYSHSGIYVYGECFSAFPAEYNETTGLYNAISGWWSELVFKGALGPEANNTWIPFNGAQNGRGVGHWTQLAWWNTIRVGCGLARCDRYKTYIVCNYDPVGNVITLGVYEIGTPCSGCPDKCNSTNKLCLN